MSAGAQWWKVLAVWLSRIVCGLVFIVSGWSKTVDPHGFVFKIEEYLNVWGISDIIPLDIVLIGAVGLSLFELITGVLLLTGSLRRSAAICGLAMMAFMLPLTAYIVVADPVADCGCFGDLIVISNMATFLKNIFIIALLVVALTWRKAAMPLYRPGLQWLIIVMTGIYGITVATIGWQFQPVVDFRPYGVGECLVAQEDDDTAEPTYIYSKDGLEKEFSMSALPDSTWTFVRQGEKAGDENLSGLAIFDMDGNDVAYDLFDPESCDSAMLVLAVTEPGIGNLTRSRMANEVYDYATSHGIGMVGVIALSGDALQQWIELAIPRYEVYSASDTALKELVRGSVGLVYLKNGHVIWKRNFATIDPDFLTKDAPLDSIHVVDDGRVAWWLSGFYVLGMLILLGISDLTKINIKPRRKKSPVQLL